MPLSLNAGDFGALGEPIRRATGRIEASNLSLLLTNPKGWKNGAGVGVVEAGSGASFRGGNPPLRTSVKSVLPEGLLLEKAATRPTGTQAVPAQVDCDDSIPIQAALDVLAVHQGGTLSIPEGQFIVGVPGSPENAPVNIPSDVRISVPAKV